MIVGRWNKCLIKQLFIWLYLRMELEKCIVYGIFMSFSYSLHVSYYKTSVHNGENSNVNQPFKLGKSKIEISCLALLQKT